MDQTCPRSRFSLSYKNEEWQILEDLARARHYPNLHALIYSRINKLVRLQEYASHITDEERRKREFMMPAGVSCQIVELARIYGVSVAQLVDRIIVSPMFREHYEPVGIIMG